MPKKPIKGEKLLDAWTKAKEGGVTRKGFARQLGISEKSLDNRLYRAMNPNSRDNEQKTNTVRDVTDGNYRIITAHGVRHQSVNELLKHLNVDLTIWRIADRYEVGSWEMGRRSEKKSITWERGRIEEGYTEDTGLLFIDTLHRFKVPLVRINPVPIEPIISPVVFELSLPEYKDKTREKTGKVLIVPDLQVGYRKDLYTGKLDPFHDRRAMDLVYQVACEGDFDAVAYLGDFADFTEWTDKFTREPEFYYTTQPAIIECAWYFARMKQAQPKAKHTAMIGNHEARLEKAIIDHMRYGYKLKPATELHLDDPMSINRLFGFDNMEIELIKSYPNGEVWYGDNSRCIHGFRVSGNPGATATNVIREIMHTTIFGHIHRIERATKTVEDNKGIRYVTAASPGCLCRLDYVVPGHKRGQNWQQGFGVLHYDSRSPQIELIQIFEGEAVYNGKRYIGNDYSKQLTKDTQWKF